ncbi:acyl-CoA thioesterase [bacterium]|nr:acyl-CoA thioesterase [bacterium]
MPHEMTVRVRGYHCDFYGHLNNARYLELLEEARWQWAESVMDLPAWQAAGFGFVVAGIDTRTGRALPLAGRADEPFTAWRRERAGPVAG